jgi:hypothetical protein
VLHLGIGGEQELDDDADLVGRGERRQVLARLRQRDGVALAGVEIAAHQVQDCRCLAVELQGCGLERGLWHGGGGGCRCVLPQGEPDDDAETDEAEGREPDQPGLDRRQTRGEHPATRTRPPAALERALPTPGDSCSLATTAAILEDPSAVHCKANPLRSG